MTIGTDDAAVREGVSTATGEPAAAGSSPLTVVAPAMLLVMSLAVVLRYASLELDNQDTWFHLTLGEHFRTDWSLADPGSLTPFATSDWVATQWLT